MRCATCGTENAPDSRFCGGCGARQPASGEQRLAPTAKIHDDAPYPAQATTGARSAAAQGPVSYAPPSIPPPAMATPPPGSIVRGSEPPPSQFGPTPAAQRSYVPPTHPQTSQNRPASAAPASRPPTSNPPTSQNRPVSPVSAPPRAAPQVSSASGSIAVPPQRPMGLIVLVLLVDLGLAATGSVLLAKGLATPDKK